MINTSEIEYLVKLALHTPFIDREKGVSMMIIAPPEHGKSEILKKFVEIESAKITTDFNSHIFTTCAFDIQNGGLKTIVIPDFLRVTKRKQSTASNSLTILNSLTEEGYTGTLPLGQIINAPIHANIITALTQDEMQDKRHKWTKLGFLSRFVPVTYSYKEDTKEKIRSYIKDRMYKNDNPYKFAMPQNQVEITLPPKIADKIETIGLDISEKSNLLGFRLQRQLQTLTMANALVSGRNIVTIDDFKVIESLARHINFKFNVV